MSALHAIGRQVQGGWFVGFITSDFRTQWECSHQHQGRVEAEDCARKALVDAVYREAARHHQGRA